jgi:uncharacterized protein
MPLAMPELLAKQIGAFPHVEKVILFGSRARGDADANSDIDLAVVCPEADYPEWALIQRMAETSLTIDKIDIVRFERAPEFLRKAIERDGKVLYAKGE